MKSYRESECEYFSVQIKCISIACQIVNVIFKLKFNQEYFSFRINWWPALHGQN